MKTPKQIYREIKREIKKAGKRDMRNYLKRQLRNNPEEAHWDEYDYGLNSTQEMNGMYLDPKRNKDERITDSVDENCD